MKLLVDIGNTALKWARWDGRDCQAGGRLPWREQPFESALLQAWGPQPPDAIWLAAVANSELVRRFSQWVERQWGLPVTQVTTSDHAFGVVNAYAQVDHLGVDRWLALIGARARFPDQALWVVDCGSAITLDYLDAQGRHRGGLILPGLAMMHAGLRRGAHALDQPLAPASPRPVLGEDTDIGMQHGILAAAVGAVELAQRRMAPEPQAPCLNLITGGDASRMLPWLQGEWQVVEDLVFNGLAQYAAEDGPERAGGGQ